MSSSIAAKVAAAAGSGLAVGAAGMFLYDRRARVGDPQSNKDTSTLEVEYRPRALPTEADTSSPVASDFIMPFVKQYGLPDLDQIILPSREYTSCWDSRTRNVRWVLERINEATVMGAGDRKRASFRADSRLEPLFRTELSDYRGSGLDRGHLAPAGDHKTTEQNLKETFLLTNMAPQNPSFNRGYWSDFEEWIRLLVVPKEDKGEMSAASSTGSSENPKNGPPFRDVYVITGPLFLPSREEEAGGGSNGSDGTDVDADGDGIVEVNTSSSSASTDAAAKYLMKYDIIGTPMRMVGVPTHFFKVIVAEPFSSEDNKVYVAAFVMPNAKIENNTDLRNFLVPLEVLESVAGLRFLPGASQAGNNSSDGGLDLATREFLYEQALVLRAGGADAGAQLISPVWVNRPDIGPASGTQDGGDGDDDAGRVLFRHLCSEVSCRGV